MEYSIPPYTGLSRMTRLAGSISWFPELPRLILLIIDYSLHKIKDDILSMDDPMPAVGFFAACMRYVFDKKCGVFVKEVTFEPTTPFS